MAIDERTFDPGLRAGSTIPTGNLATDNGIVSGNVSKSLAQFTTVTITAAQFQGAFAAPVSIIAAPGAGLVNIVTDFVLDNAGGTAYAAGGSSTYLVFGTTQFITNPIGTSVFFSTASSVTYAGPLSTSTAIPNTAVSLWNTTAAYTTGTGTLTAYVWYSIVTAI